MNHVFDITFSIAPDALIEYCLIRPLGLTDSSRIRSIAGAEIPERYGFGAMENVTQPDGFFVSAKSLMGVEIKLGAGSNPAQIAKYLALMAWEEKKSGPREQVGLLYIIRDPTNLRHWKSCELPGPTIDRTYLETMRKVGLPTRVRKLFDEEPERIVDLLHRMKLAAISWSQLRATALEYREMLNPAAPGDQTLHRLIEGLVAQIDEHVPG